MMLMPILMTAATRTQLSPLKVHYVSKVGTEGCTLAMIQMILGAKECVGEALASLRPPIPAWMETSFALDHVIQSGFYIHFTCKEGPYPDLKYKEYQEPGMYLLHCSTYIFNPPKLLPFVILFRQRTQMMMQLTENSAFSVVMELSFNAPGLQKSNV